MLCNKLLPHTIDISKEIISNVKSAHQRYKEQQILKKREDKRNKQKKNWLRKRKQFY